MTDNYQIERGSHQTRVSQYSEVVDFSVIEGKLKKLKKPQLINFMVQIGNQLKEEECHRTLYITRDYESMKEINGVIQVRIEQKREKIKKLDDSSVDYNKEIQRVEIGIETNQRKIEDKKGQLVQAQALVKKQKEELRGILKRITPKLVENLYQLLKKQAPHKIVIMLESLVGLLKNSKEVASYDVEVYIQKYESLIFKMQKVDPALVSEEVVSKHFDQLKAINKFFTERENNEHYATCSPYTPLLAWANQFCYLTQHARRAQKVENNIKTLENAVQEYVDKKTYYQSVISNINKDDQVALFKKELEADESRFEKFKSIYERLEDEVVIDQQNHVKFDKNFFMELEEFVIQKKKSLKK